MRYRELLNNTLGNIDSLYRNFNNNSNHVKKKLYNMTKIAHKMREVIRQIITAKFV